MKLFQKYKDIVRNVQPELAWFTTYNLSIDLLERFLVPPLVNMETSEIRTAEDYEALNQETAKINIKVWYDYRALDISTNKRTTIDIEYADIKTVLDSKSEEPLFHPKIIFLKGIKSAYLIAGSANLSFAGWSSNRESVLTKEILCRENANEIYSFFESISKRKPMDKSISQGLKQLKLWINTLPDNATDWHFKHNFNIRDNLLKELSAEKLHIWSPYFSRETSRLIDEIRLEGVSEINLIPDNSSGAIRILKEQVDKLHESKVRILNDNSKQPEQGLVHAKVWLTEKLMAVGSWNCSFRATGLIKPQNLRNIEAGIIQSISTYQTTKLKESLDELTPSQINCFTETQLEEEKQQTCSYKLYVRIIANWREFKYYLDTPLPDKKYNVVLPDNTEMIIPISDVEGRSFLKGHFNLLHNRLFKVTDANNEVVFSGYLIEQEKEVRPYSGYTSLPDLFEALYRDPLKETESKRTLYRIPEEMESGDEGQFMIQYSGLQSSYFMFVAFQKLRDSIKENETNESKLHYLGFSSPSSLLNMSMVLAKSVSIALLEKQEDTLLFHLLACKEFNETIDWYYKFHKRKIEKLDLTNLEKCLRLRKNDRQFINKVYGSQTF